MTRTIVFGLALIAAAFIGRGYIEAAQADAEDVKTWKQFHQELVATRQALRTIQAAAGAETWRQDECRFQSLQQPTWTPMEEQLTAECALRHWNVEGGYTRFYSVGQCESGWNRLASNSGRYLGLFQHAAPYWDGRVRSFDPAHWDKPLSERWTNSRTQVIVTARMVHGGGWGPWSCA